MSCTPAVAKVIDEGNSRALTTRFWNYYTYEWTRFYAWVVTWCSETTVYYEVDLTCAMLIPLACSVISWVSKSCHNRSTVWLVHQTTDLLKNRYTFRNEHNVFCLIWQTHNTRCHKFDEFLCLGFGSIFIRFFGFFQRLNNLLCLENRK